MNTEQNQIRVVGTKFNVCSYNGTDIFETALVEGIIDVYNVMDEATPIARLHKDEMLIAESGMYKRSKMDSHDFLRWKEGLYCFDDAPLSEVFDKLQKYYNISIVVENPSVLNYRCTGKFKERDGIEHILRVIQKDHSFSFKTDVERNTITVK